MAVEVLVPELGESVVEATVGGWLKQEGDTVSVGDILVELETDKVDLEVGADASGVLVKIVRQEGEDVAIGDVLAVIEAGEGGASRDGGGSAAEVEKTEPMTEKGAASAEGSSGEKVTPVAKRMAAEAGVDLGEVTGSGPGGKITKEDVSRHVAGEKEEQKEAAAKPTAAKQGTKPASAPALATDGDGRPEERIKMSRRRRTIARRLVEAQQTAAMLTTFNEVDMSAVIDMRTRWKEKFLQQEGVKLGFTSFFVKAVIGGLKAFPRLNAEIAGDEMVLKSYYDVGIAVGAEEGLVVPVLRDADKMSFAKIEGTVREFGSKAREGNLTLDDLRGGTFTITNGGVFGSMLSTPILNPPQVGILGLHNIVERPVAVDGQVEIRPIMYVALSYDHRIVDGREAVSFLVKVKELIEDPEALLLA
ncbi:MAG TPA: 2-oxoglutarate dehydrogenase complex dihydrolipoyllysine-residue succinyltransferase [Anaerolineae bacterium]|nr:2-oxoglutarate dehydrogenase complex dihydrolipoyllysine-residue succinyltransferase [Anaerolineae bacterium]